MDWLTTLWGVVYENTHGDSRTAQLRSIDDARKLAAQGLLREEETLRQKLFQEVAVYYFKGDTDKLLVALENFQKSMRSAFLAGNLTALGAGDRLARAMEQSSKGMKSAYVAGRLAASEVSDRLAEISERVNGKS